jgi:curved DNA-binding protein CbpA
MNRDEALEVFGLTTREFAAMDKREITKIFRKKALETHPDKGGDHDAFVRVIEAYKTLLKRKR